MEPNKKSSNTDVVKSSSRRAILRSTVVASAGVGLTGVVTGNTDDSVEITYATRIDTEKQQTKPLKKEVPKDWYNNVNHAMRIFIKKSDSYIDRPGVNGVYYRPAEYGGDNSKIIISLDPDNGQSTTSQSSDRVSPGDVPERIEDVPIELERTKKLEKTCHGDKDYHPSIPGGAYALPSPGSGQTFCSRVRDSNWNSYFATTAHGYSDPCNINDQEVFHPQGSGSQDVGTLMQVNESLDLAIIVPFNNATPTAEIARSDHSIDPVEAVYTQSGLNDLIGQGESVSKSGQTTCETGGKLHSIGKTASYSTCGSNIQHQFRFGNYDDVDGGDSGSPVWHRESDGTYLVGMVTGHYDGLLNDYSSGTAAYAVSNNTNFTFA